MPQTEPTPYLLVSVKPGGGVLAANYASAEDALDQAAHDLREGVTSSTPQTIRVGGLDGEVVMDYPAIREAMADRGVDLPETVELEAG